MLRVSLLSLISLALIAGCDLQGAAPRSDVAIVDIDAVARALGRDDVIAQQIDQANQQLSAQVVQIAQNLQGQLQDFQDSLDEADGEQLEQRTAEANRQLQATQQEARQRAALYRSAVVTQFRNEVQPVASEVARGLGASIVLTSAVPALWFDPAIDITDEVIAAMRARGLEPAATPAPTAPPVPATPAAAGDQSAEGGENGS